MLAVAAALVAFSGCATHAPGLLYASQTVPTAVLDSYPWNTGRACMWSYFGLVTVGDASIRAAMKSGKLGRVAVVDTETQGALGIFRVCTIAYGPFGDVGPPDEKR